jgi:hypothetical protein
MPSQVPPGRGVREVTIERQADLDRQSMAAVIAHK